MDKIPSSHKFHTSPAANPTSLAAASSPEQPAVWARILPADKQDVPVIHRLVCQLAGFLRFNHVFSATEFSIPLLRPLPHSLPSVIPLPHRPPPPPSPNETPRTKKKERRTLVPSAQSSAESSWPRRWRTWRRRRSRRRGAGGWLSPGSRCAFPSTRRSGRSRGCTWRDCSIVREAWRRRGLGRMLLSAVAAQAVRMGLPKVEWDVVNWNAGAVGFYEGMGAVEQRDGRPFKLSGEALEAYGTEEGGGGRDDACVRWL